MKKLLLSVIVFTAMGSYATASETIVPLDLKKANLDILKCSGWYTVKDRSGNLIDGGIYSSDESGSDCLNGFSGFIKKLMAAYPDASVYGQQ